MNHGRWTSCVLLCGLAAFSCSTGAAPSGEPVGPQHPRAAQAAEPAASPPDVPGDSQSSDWLLGGPLAAALPRVAAPEALGMLVGPQAKVGPTGVRFFGTDMGLTVEHRGQLHILLAYLYLDE